MKNLLVAVLLLAVCRPIGADEPIRERIEWIDIWVTDAEKSELPRVLLIGDSITRGYFGPVEAELAGKAYCARLTTSKCVSDPTFNDDVLLLLKQYRFSVIHLNNGLHGWGYHEEQYRAGLQQTVTAIREHAGDAKIIWATTTPIRERADLQAFNPQTDRVTERNRLAAEIVKDNGLATDDLFELVKSHPDWQSADGVHFNNSGNDAMAQQVADSILKALP